PTTRTRHRAPFACWPPRPRASGMTDADRLDRVESVEAIRQLVSRYALATDSRDLHALVELFVDDVQLGAQARGRDALRTFFQPARREVGITILFVGNHVIDFDHDDHARGVVYCRGEVQVDDRWVVQAIQYRDTYERRNGVWYFVRRKHLLWYAPTWASRPSGCRQRTGPSTTPAAASCPRRGRAGASSGGLDPAEWTRYFVQADFPSLGAAVAQPVHVVDDLEALQVLGHPLRVRILEQLREPGSAATVAREV